MVEILQDYSQVIIPVITLIAGWVFGGRQKNKITEDNESHQREKDFFEIVDKRTEREVSKTMKRIMKCANRCPYSASCPVKDIWEIDE